MVRDAETHAEEDRKRRESVEARNRLDSLVYQTEKNLEDWKESLDESARNSITAAVERGKAALKQDDSAEITAATEAIQQAVQAAAQQIYAQAGAQAETEAAGEASGFEEPGGESAAPTDDDEVVEADYEIVEDK
jgi:molecular chaperone DnaK